MFSEEYRQAARFALAIQNACNLSGIMLSLPEVIDAVIARKRELNEGTEWFNKHPVMYMVSVQIGYLTGACSVADGDYIQQMKRCEAIADGDPNNKWVGGL